MHPLIITMLLLLAAHPLRADYPLEIIEVKGRPVEQIIPIIKPFISSDGSVAGMNNQLIIRTSVENLAEIRRILEQIDRPPRRLMITVRQGRISAPEAQELSADIMALTGRQGRLATGNPDKDKVVRLSGMHAEAGSRDDLSHRVQTLEDRPTFIATGRRPRLNRSQFYYGGPFVQYGGEIDYLEAVSGFYARVRLSGDRVQIDISPRMERSAAEGAEIDGQQTGTTVSGALGEWIAVGGISGTGFREHTGIGYSGSTRSSLRRDIFLRVDPLP